ERTRALLHLLDASHADAVDEFDMVNRELALFNADLAARPMIVALNKIDLPEAQANLPQLVAALEARGIKPLTLSVATGENVRALVDRVARLLDELRATKSSGGWAEAGGAATAPKPPAEAPEELDGDLTVVHPKPARRFEVRKARQGVYVVEGRRLEALAQMMHLSEDESRAEFYRRLTRFGVVAALRRAGIENGDRVRFGPTEMTWDGE
ncbi:MAG: Obg family GTPase CgtA, partial [Dehalococcoidia bacterium]